MYKKIAFYLCLELLLSCTIFSFSDDSKDLFMAELHSKHEQLNHNNPYSFFDLELSDDEHITLESLQIHKNLHFHSFGDIDNLQEEVSIFLHNLGNDQSTAESCSVIIYKRVQIILQALGVQDVWVTIRASCPSHFVNPIKWHIDQYPMSSFVCFDRKIVFVLKGSGTLFSDAPDDVRSRFFATRSLRPNRFRSKRNVDSNGVSQDDSSESQVVRDLLASYNVQQTAQGHGAIFIIGNKNDAVIHSEPDNLSNRLFVAIVPGRIV